MLATLSILTWTVEQHEEYVDYALLLSTQFPWLGRAGIRRIRRVCVKSEVSIR